MLKGITVRLITRTDSGSVDAFNRPIYTETSVDVENVLVAPASSTEILNTTELEGKKLVYTLAIPKGDDHDWTDCKVQFFGKTFKSFGDVTEGIEAMVPLKWHKKVQVALYE